MATPVPRIGIAVATLVGLGISCLAVRMVGRELAFEAGAQRIGGEVVAFQQRADDHTGITYAPIFRFTTADGRTLDRPSRVASRPVAWSIGERALVLYDPREPASVVADTWSERWSPVVLLALVASIFFACAAVFVRTRIDAAKAG